MTTVDSVLAHAVARQNGPPEINGLVAGWTTRCTTRYLKPHGVSDLDNPHPVLVDTPMALFSCTKSITSMAMLKLWEDGRVDLDGPAKRYLPVLGGLGVLDHDLVDLETGRLTKPLRRPQTDVTVRHLLLHTAAFGYAFTDARYLALHKRLGALGANPAPVLFTAAASPHLAEPGSRWIYGHAHDWAGLVIEAITGTRLSHFLHTEIFRPAGMAGCTFQMTHPHRMMRLHHRRGQLQVRRKWPIPFRPDIDMGGQGCFGPVADYLRFLRIWLNHGVCPDTGVRILRRNTVAHALENHLPESLGVDFPTPVTGDANHRRDGFTLAGFAYSRTAASTGRPQGLVYWSGLANVYVWLDVANGVAGMFACQILPYLDQKCVQYYLEFERAVYDEMRREHL